MLLSWSAGTETTCTATLWTLWGTPGHSNAAAALHAAAGVWIHGSFTSQTFSRSDRKPKYSSSFFKALKADRRPCSAATVCHVHALAVRAWARH